MSIFEHVSTCATLPRAQSGHGPHWTAPGTLTHTVAASHPPLAPSAHSSMSAHVVPSPSYPAGQLPHVLPTAGGAMSVQSTRV